MSLLSPQRLSAPAVKDIWWGVYTSIGQVERDSKPGERETQREGDGNESRHDLWLELNLGPDVSLMLQPLSPPGYLVTTEYHAN